MLRMALPANSIALYSAPSTPIMPMMCRMMSLPVTPGVELALNLEQQRLGHLEPRLAGGIADAGVGGAHARGKRAERAVGAGVAVGADDEVARAHNALLGQKRMLNTHAADFVIVRDALLAGEFAHAAWPARRF